MYSRIAKILLFFLRLGEIIIAFGLPVAIFLLIPDVSANALSITGRRIVYALSSLFLLFLLKIVLSPIERRLAGQAKKDVKESE